MFKKIQRIFKSGYVPDRGDETYFYNFIDPVLKQEVYTSEICNCFGHACFNLKNEHFKNHKISLVNRDFFYNFGTDLETKNNEEIEKLILKKIESVGLIPSLAKDTTQLKNNQWKVAMYIDRISFGQNDVFRDYHFMLQEKDGRWSSKDSFKVDVEKYDELTKHFGLYYKLHNVYTITNPNAKER